MKIKTILTAISLLVILLLPITHGAFALQGEKYSATLKNGVWDTKVNKQVQITSDITNNQDRSQPFAYLVQIQSQDGVVVSLSWLTGSLDPGQSLNPSQSWIPTLPGNYNAQIFVWAGINNPDALSVPLTMKITVT
ncbi:MAG: hypothetical protein E6L02_07090 [Thaumarchaeota archaeon]|nr:MAG: hypothetical protein E6L02_07090 [Nitrososphaerota archaeon]